MEHPEEVEAVKRQVHDALVKRTFGHQQHAADMLRALLPDELVAVIDWGSIELQPGSFVNDEMRQLHTDLLFTVEIGDSPALLYILLEQQANPDGMMGFRVTNYTVQIWDKARRDGKGLPPVLPIVLYNGLETWWPKRDVFELIEGPPAVLDLLRPYLPSQRYVLEELRTRGPEEIRRRTKNPIARLVYMALHRGRTVEDIYAELDAWVDDIKAGLELDLETVALVFCYLMNVNPTAQRAGIRAHLERQLGAERAEELTMTEGEKLILRGVKRGYEKGMRNGREEARAAAADTLKSLAAARFGPLPASFVARVEVADMPTLQRWTRAILNASSLDALLDS